MWTSLRDLLFDDLRTWDDVSEHLRDDWLQVEDARSGFVLLCGGDDLVVLEPPTATAKHRRTLHRAGFRRDADRSDWWRWMPSMPDEASIELPPLAASSPRLRQAWLWHIKEMRLRHDLGTAAVRVLRDLRCAPEELQVLVRVEAPDWDDDVL